MFKEIFCGYVLFFHFSSLLENMLNYLNWYDGVAGSLFLIYILHKKAMILYAQKWVS